MIKLVRLGNYTKYDNRKCTGFIYSNVLIPSKSVDLKPGLLTTIDTMNVLRFLRVHKTTSMQDKF